MDGQDYLNQISMQNRPVKKSGVSGLLSSKIFLFSMIGVVVLIIVIIIGAVLNGGKGGDKNLSFALKLHLDNTADVIQDYQSNVKSSDLRSSSASLYSILTNTSRELTDYITAKYDYRESDVSESTKNDADLARDGLESDLFQAKISGTLDRMYALKMAYEISLIKSEEAKIINSTSSSDLAGLLTTSYNSLENLYNKFNDFSEAN